jgi:hypothetical protein
VIAFQGLWGGLSLAALALAAVIVAGVIAAIARLGRLRSDLKSVQAAERHERVDFSGLVIKHVPEDLRTGVVGEEILVIKDQIGRKRSYWRRAGCGLAVLAVVAGGLAVVTMRHSIAVAKALAADEDLSKEVTSLIQGVWGWKYDFERSCEENSQTITVSVAGDRLTVTTRKPHWNGQQYVRADEFAILARNRRGLTLGMVGGPAPGDHPTERVTWDFVFLDRDTYYVRRSDAPVATTGMIIRCPDQSHTAEH